MFHKSKLSDHAHHFPADADGNIPERHDHWSKMNFAIDADSPDEPGISEQERARRVKFLDEQWWPTVLAQVDAGHEALDALPSENPIRQWRDRVMKTAPAPHGYEVDPVDQHHKP